MPFLPQILAAALTECHRKSSAQGKPLALKAFVAGRNRLENDGATALAEAFGVSSCHPSRPIVPWGGLALPSQHGCASPCGLARPAVGQSSRPKHVESCMNPPLQVSRPWPPGALRTWRGRSDQSGIYQAPQWDWWCQGSVRAGHSLAQCWPGLPEWQCSGL